MSIKEKKTLIKIICLVVLAAMLLFLIAFCTFSGNCNGGLETDAPSTTPLSGTTSEWITLDSSTPVDGTGTSSPDTTLQPEDTDTVSPTETTKTPDQTTTAAPETTTSKPEETTTATETTPEVTIPPETTPEVTTPPETTPPVTTPQTTPPVTTPQTTPSVTTPQTTPPVTAPQTTPPVTTPQTTPVTTPQGSIDTPVPDFEYSAVISLWGSTDYKLITSTYATLDTEYLFNTFTKSLRAASGTQMKTDDDNIAFGTDAGSLLEIIFGAADREECKELYAQIGYDGYAVKKIGNKIILAAYTPENLRKAANAFLNQCTRTLERKKGDISMYYVKDVVVKGTLGAFFNDSNPLSDYKIIYSSEAQSLAERFAATLRMYAGIDLVCESDSAAPTAKEILIGETNRSETAAVKVANIESYTIKVQGTKLVIRSGNTGYTDMLYDILVNEYVRPTLSFNLPANANITKFRYTGDEKTVVADGTDLRIMSFNILSEEWASDSALPPRIAAVIGCIKYYNPDVIGIQEISTKWYAELYKYLCDDYVLVNPNILSGTSNNYTGLAFNKNTMKLIEDDVYFYSIGNSQRLRLVNMGLFEHLATGKRIIVTNTHYNANHKGEQIENQNRTVQATEFLAKVQEYKAKYNCPIVSAGDYNCYEESDPYVAMTKGNFMLEAKYTASSIGAIFGTTHGLGKYPGSSFKSIDHILHTSDITPLYYTTLIDPFLSIASDHCPLYADFKFN